MESPIIGSGSSGEDGVHEGDLDSVRKRKSGVPRFDPTPPSPFGNYRAEQEFPLWFSEHLYKQRDKGYQDRHNYYCPLSYVIH